MSLSYGISIIERNEIENYEEPLNTHLSSIFGTDSKLIINDEFTCAVIIHNFNEVIATGFAYTRLMKQGSINFQAGIIGGIGIVQEHRYKGLSKVIVKELDKYLTCLGVTCSFLFAYNPEIYRNAGYSELTYPIRFFDTTQKCWNQFVYRGGMHKSYHCGHQLANQVIEFNGCVY